MPYLRVLRECLNSSEYSGGCHVKAEYRILIIFVAAAALLYWSGSSNENITLVLSHSRLVPSVLLWQVTWA